jgi:hypothetical protein
MYRLYFSHSYDPEDLRFNEHLWKLLMSAGFHAWIDSGREVVPRSTAAQPGARRPMDISFNEWMMSQCDGFVAIVPKNANHRISYWNTEQRCAWACRGWWRWSRAEA